MPCEELPIDFQERNAEEMNIQALHDLSHDFAQPRRQRIIPFDPSPPLSRTEEGDGVETDEPESRKPHLFQQGISIRPARLQRKGRAAHGPPEEDLPRLKARFEVRA